MKKITIGEIETILKEKPELRGLIAACVNIPKEKRSEAKQLAQRILEG